MKLLSTKQVIFSICLILVWVSLCAAQVPGKINYQGYLTDSSGAGAADGTYSIAFSIYSSSGVVLWSETQTAVEVRNGIFNVHLGQNPSGNPFPEFSGEMYLGVQVGTDPEMTPKQLLTSVPFALKSLETETFDGYQAKDFALSDHGHDFSDISGMATDAQIPDNITINHAASSDAAATAGHADTAESAVKADKAQTADYATNAGHADTADSAVTATTATTASHAATAGNADTVDGLHASAFSSAAHAHHFLNASDGSPAQALYVDSIGRVGIGSTSPARYLDVAGTGRFMNDSSTIDFNRYVSGIFPLYWTYQYGVESKVDRATHFNYGVYGSAEGATFTNYGVYGTSNATNGTGVYGVAGNSGDYATHGGLFRSYAQKGTGVRGLALYSGSEMTATSYGGYFESASPRGTGVYGKVNYSGSGLKYAGYFECDSETGYGVYATVNGSSYSNWAFRGVASGTASNGAWFSTVGTDTTAVYGNATGTSGTYNTSKGGDFRSAGNRGYGVYARADGQYGIGIYASGGSDGFAGHFRGNVKITRKSDGATVMELGEGLDFAEGFHVKKPDLIEPGTVLVIDSETPGKLRMSQDPYDTKVAGIVAGANGLGSGVRLGAGMFDHDVALAGRVYCKVEALDHDVRLGDLLTTSTIPGHAMRAADRERSHGTILGKAMEPLEKGQTGKILVLVTLQ